MQRSRFHLSTPEARIFAIALTLSLVARGSAFVSATFNVDDLMYWPVPFDFKTVGLIGFRDGRFTGPFLAAFEDALGVHAGRSFALAAMSMTLSLIATALLICRIWKLEADFVASAAAVALLVLHPYQADLFTWKIALMNGGIPFVITFAALHYGTRGYRGFGLAVLALVVAMGIHQLPLQMATAVLALAVPIGLVRRTFDARQWTVQLGILIVGVLVYLVLAKVVIAMSAHSGSLGRDKILLFTAPGLVLARATELLAMMAWRDPMVGWLTRLLLVGVALLTAWRISIAQSASIQERVGHLAAAAIALCVACIASIALTIVPHAWMPAFRNFMSLGVVWAAVAVLALSVSSGAARKATCATIGIILFAFIGTNNQVLSDQQRVNQRDLALMNRIAYAVDNTEKSEPTTKIAFVGTTSTPLTSIATAADFSTGWHTYGTTLSVFSVFWPTYLLALYQEATGYKTVGNPTTDNIEWAEKNCVDRRWPARDSVFSQGPLAVVCLGPPTRFHAGPFDPPA